MSNRLSLAILATLIVTLIPINDHNLANHYDYKTTKDTLFVVDNGYVQNYTESGNLTVSLSWIPSFDTNISYTIIHDHIIRYSGTLEIVDNVQSYNIPIFHHIISPCICIAEIEIISDTNVLALERVLLNAKDIIASEDYNIVSVSQTELVNTHIFDFEIALLLPDSIDTFSIKSSIINENVEGCLHGKTSEDSIDIRNISGIIEEYSNYSIINGKMNLQYNLSSYDDGWISLFVEIGNGNYWSNHIACITTKIDLTPPIISIEAPIEIEEKIGLLIIDSSSTFDQFWGREGLQYFWTYQQIDDPYSIPITSVGDSTGIFTFDASNSGIYQFNLSVIDTASHTSKRSIIIEILNVRPEANMRIDSVPVTDGQIIRLTNEQSWNVDATYSIDTQNDIDNLSYTWFLDGKPIMSGMDRVLTRPEYDNELHELTLMVEDNDGAVDWVTVSIGIAGTPSDPNESPQSTRIVATVSVLILMCTILVFFIISGRNNRTPNIRQWTTSAEETTKSRTDD